jgi:lysyl-tRNA synthetase class II
MKRTRTGYASFAHIRSFIAIGCLLAINFPAFSQDSIKIKQPSKGQTAAPDQEESKTKDLKEVTKETTKEASKEGKEKDTAKIPETPIENVVAVTTEQLVNKPEEYLNKNVKFTAPFFAFSNLALDYKPAFRSSRTYLSFLVLRPNSHTPFSEIKLAMLIPKEKDPLTKTLGTIKEGDIVEITGHVFASSLDEPWLDVLRMKKIASAKKVENPDDKTADDKDSSSEDQSSDKKSEE